MNSMFYSYDGVLAGLNYWPKLMMISIIVMIVVGFNQYTMKSGRIRHRYNERIIGLFSAFFAAAVAVAIFVECADVIVKYCDNNCLSMYDSSAWSVILMFLFVEFCGLMWFALDYAIGVGVGKARRKMISKKRHHIQNQNNITLHSI